MVLSVFSVTGFINFSDFSIICISFPICARANATFFSIKESVLADCLFFSGSVWYLYELSGDTTLLSLADKYTSAIEEAKKLTWHHDVGFMINCSFGNGWRTTKVPKYKEVMIEAARSLATRFREKPGIIQSWDVTRGWQSERGWECPVIIDNMMNL